MESDNISVIDTQSCLKLTDKNSPFILVIHKGENLINALLHCFEALNIQGASLSGLGAVENPKIAYFDRETKAYREKMFLDVPRLFHSDFHSFLISLLTDSLRRIVYTVSRTFSTVRV